MRPGTTTASSRTTPGTRSPSRSSGPASTHPMRWSAPTSAAAPPSRTSPSTRSSRSVSAPGTHDSPPDVDDDDAPGPSTHFSVGGGRSMGSPGRAGEGTRMTARIAWIGLTGLLLSFQASAAATVLPDAATQDPPAVRAALEGGAVAALEHGFVAARERSRADRSSPDLERWVDAFRKLSRPQAEALYAWNHEAPRSAPARLALASHYLGEAWRARGTRFT